MQLLITAEVVAWGRRSDTPFSGAIVISSILTGKEIWSCTNQCHAQLRSSNKNCCFKETERKRGRLANCETKFIIMYASLFTCMLFFKLPESSCSAICSKVPFFSDDRSSIEDRRMLDHNQVQFQLYNLILLKHIGK